jgi:hypothetical protein
MVVKFGGYNHVHFLYDLSFDSRCDDDRIFPNRSVLFDRIISDLLDGLA